MNSPPLADAVRRRGEEVDDSCDCSILERCRNQEGTPLIHHLDTGGPFTLDPRVALT
jgi:hypothetical protein